MIGSTRSSTKRRTLSRTARSSSERSDSIPKKSIIRGKATSGSHGSPGERSNPHFARFLSECGSVVDGQAALVLPLVYHLMEERVERLLPPVVPQMPAADGDLRRLAALRGGGVVAQAGAHSAGDADV